MRIKKILRCFFSLLSAILILASPVFALERIRMATTTSTENSGLLYELLPVFEEKFKIKVDVIAVGTGKALKLGENGDVDIVFVHERGAEDSFVNSGFGVNRRDVMYNDFVIVGPVNDPAIIKGKDVLMAFKNIADKRYFFVSRGDDSGTHKKEKKIWDMAEIRPEGKWYLETGQGMGAALCMANEKKAYCLVDRGTFIAYENKIELMILCEGDKILLNQYGIIAVNPKRHTSVKYKNAMVFIDWITSLEGRKIIAGFKKNGKALFHPNVYEDAGHKANMKGKENG